MAKYFAGGEQFLFYWDGAAWNNQNITSIDANIWIHAIHGLDDQNVWAGGSTTDCKGNGTAKFLRTTDGGDTWSALSTSGLDTNGGIADLYVVAEDEIYAATWKYAYGIDRVYKWSGSSWSLVRNADGYVHSVWGTATDDVYHTTDESGVELYQYNGVWHSEHLTGFTGQGSNVRGYNSSNMSVCQYIVGSSTIKVARGSFGSWSIDTLKSGFYEDTGNYIYHPLAVDSNGYPSVISTHTSGTWAVEVAMYNGSSYDYFSLGTGKYCAMAYSADDDMCAIHCENVSGSFEPNSWFWNGVAWSDGGRIGEVGDGLTNNKCAVVWAVPDSNEATGTSDDLKENIGVPRNLFVKIHGYEPVLWQYNSLGEPSGAGWDRSVLTCLSAPTELSMGLNLAEGVADVSGLTIELDNIKDTDTTYRFAKEFAPARWESVGHVRQGNTIEPEDDEFITTFGTDTEIPDEAGTLYIGSETITYTGVEDQLIVGGTGSKITGITRDVYPCIADTSLGRRYRTAGAYEGGTRMPISTVPFTYAGRKVALYAVTWNKDLEKWNDEDDAVLVWAGRISDSIEFDGTKNKWSISCESLMKDLDQKISVTQRKTTMAKVINLLGASEASRTIQCTQEITEKETHSITAVIPQGIYTPEKLAYAINVAFNLNNWTELTPAATTEAGRVWLNLHDGKYVIVCEANLEREFRFYFNDQCHVMQAMGFDVAGNSNITIAVWGGPTSSEYETSTWEAKKAAYDYYMPLKYIYNGGKMIIENPASFISDAGDHHAGSLTSTVRIKNVKAGEDKITGYFRYTKATGQISVFNGVFYSAPSYPYFDLIQDERFEEYVDNLAFVGVASDKDQPEVEQVFVPWARTTDSVLSGPFNIILRMLMSTGSGNQIGTGARTGINYSGTGTNYDVLHGDFGLGIPYTLINVTSFNNADSEIETTSLYARGKYPIESESLKDIIAKECKLFGYAISWVDGQYTIVKVMPPRVDINRATIDESNIIDVLFQPKLSMSTGTVINQYNCNVNFNMYSNKFEGATVITDMDSKNSLNQVRSTRIEHKGLWTKPGERVSPEELSGFLLNRFIRYPMPTIQVPLAPTLINQVYVGDTVLFESDKCPDPFGDGTLTTSCYAIVTNLSWDFKTWIGNATLLFIAQASTYPLPWAGTAVVDQTATNGGWDAGTYQLTVQAWAFGDYDDSKDASGLLDGHAVRIIERDPEDPSNPLNWGPFDLDGDFEDDGSNIITLDSSTTMATWDATREYIVVSGNYSEATAVQKQAQTYISDNGGFVSGTTRGSLLY